MAKLYCPIQFQHQADDFWVIYKASVCAVERRRAQFFALRAEGRSEDEVMGITKFGVSTARLMIGRYHTLGLAGLQDGRAQNRGRPRVLLVSTRTSSRGPCGVVNRCRPGYWPSLANRCTSPGVTSSCGRRGSPPRNHDPDT